MKTGEVAFLTPDFQIVLSDFCSGNRISDILTIFEICLDNSCPDSDSLSRQMKLHSRFHFQPVSSVS